MRQLIIAIALVSALLLPVREAAAERVYVWTDRYGVTHMSQEPPPPGAEAREVRLPGRNTGGVSERVQRIRCRDFRGALEQLDALDDVRPDNRQWLAARERAQRGIGEWCD
ncbi:DUF4124 domain-containing protein [Sediminicurvatus halobius]|uniref:DUF4124 domain-containing protein n=1 Tax=Sediminicurvatus halobius TaxID=2182432 RepID=UPI001304B235|nr:DUF4124 domain-containing protein [Spiribacter halobius]UEX76470.1 DUF4124 domain-containing protein [Spiribacter halobius]